MEDKNTNAAPEISKSSSIAILLLIYVIGAVLGIVVARTVSISNFAIRLIVADLVATVFIFVFSISLKNSSVYDPYWSVQPIVIILSVLFGKGKLTTASVLVLIAVILWGARLTANFVYGWRGLSHEDWRYSELRRSTGKFFPVVNLLGIHVVPTVIVCLASLPAAYAVRFTARPDALTYIGFALAIIATVIEAVADAEMHSFKKSAVGGLIRNGLWKYSRHPNYLGEIIFWWAIALIAVSLFGFYWYFVLGATLNTLLFITVSIPMQEKRQSKKDGYAEYKKNTNFLLPVNYKKFIKSGK